jgi:hypothetical protein
MHDWFHPGNLEHMMEERLVPHAAHRPNGLQKLESVLTNLISGLFEI